MYAGFVDYVGNDGGIAGFPISELFVFYQDDPPVTPVNLTGCTGRFALRANGATGAVMLEATTANGGMTITGFSGTVSIRTALMTPAHAVTTEGKHAYSVEITNADGELVCVVTGIYELRKRV